MAPRGKVYVIDDDEAMRDSLDFLLGAADFDVTLFESAQHFFDGLPSDFGCVVSDIRMPGIDGIELLQRLKASHISFPVLIMTGHGDVRHYLDARADAPRQGVLRHPIAGVVEAHGEGPCRRLRLGPRRRHGQWVRE